jgi:hypothetical protein
MKTTNDLVRLDRGMFKSLIIGNYILSIQGSSGHFSTPSEDLPSNKYVSFEMMIFKLVGQQDFNFRCSSIFRAFPRYAELNEFTSYGDNLFAWLPKDIIDDLIIYLNTRS